MIACCRAIFRFRITGHLSAGQQYLRNQPYLTMFPGIAIVITIISLTLMGDGLRDALDPRMKR